MHYVLRPAFSASEGVIEGLRQVRYFCAVRFVRLEKAVGRIIRQSAIAACTCATALSLTCTSATSQNKQGDEPPQESDVQTVEGNLGKSDPAPSSPPSGTATPPSTTAQPAPSSTPDAATLATTDAAASRSLAAALAQDPCNKSLIAQAELQISADVTLANMLGGLAGIRMHWSTVEREDPLREAFLGTLKDLLEAQATLTRELIRARAAQCVMMADIPPATPQQPQTPGPSQPLAPPTTTCKLCEEFAKQIADIDEQLNNQREQDRRLRRQANLNDSGIQRALEEIEAKIAELEAKRKQVQAKKEECERGCKEGGMIDRPPGQFYV